jgi:hypothetical protein
MMIRDYTKSSLFENPLKQSPKIQDGLHQDLALKNLFELQSGRHKKIETQPNVPANDKLSLDLRPVERN